MSLTGLARLAAAHWGAAPLRLITDRENAVYEMVLAQSRAALRLHRIGYQSDAAIESELWWCAALAAAGVAVPAALPAREGYLVTLPGGRRASAVTWLEGEPLGQIGRPLAHPPEKAQGLYLRLGALLARVHRESDGLTLPPAFTRPHWDMAGLVGEAPLWGRFWDHPAALAPERATLHALRRHLQNALSTHGQQGGAFGLIHADVLPENVLVAQGQPSLIDFDDSGFGFRLYDIGTALLHCLNGPSYADVKAALMAGYGTQDAQMVDVFAAARACASVGWVMRRRAPDDPVHRSHIARACEAARLVLG